MQNLHSCLPVSNLVETGASAYIPSIEKDLPQVLCFKGDMMTAIDTRISAGTSSIGFGARLMAALTEWNNARTTRNELNRLTDRELDDIGLCRGDIERVARGF